LSCLGAALFEAGVTLQSAHVATYGERAVDTFYVTGRNGAKITGKARLASLEAAMIAAARRNLDRQNGSPRRVRD